MKENVETESLKLLNALTCTSHKWLQAKWVLFLLCFFFYQPIFCSWSFANTIFVKIQENRDLIISYFRACTLKYWRATSPKLFKASKKFLPDNMWKKDAKFIVISSIIITSKKPTRIISTVISYQEVNSSSLTRIKIIFTQFTLVWLLLKKLCEEPSRITWKIVMYIDFKTEIDIYQNINRITDGKYDHGGS